MNKKIAAALLALVVLVPLTGYAQGNYRSNNTSRVISSNKVYLGVKFGQVSLELDVSGSDRESVADNMGFVFGGDINDYLALEFEYTKTVSSDLVEIALTPTQTSFDTVGIFLVAKSTGSLYGKARLGYSWVEQDFDSFGSDTVYGLAYGLGAGFKASDTFYIEGEYTIYPESDETDRFGNAFGADLNTDIISVNLVWSYN
jgi:opacity protein-like surface antigen